MMTATAARDVAALRLSMRTPPLFEPPPPGASYAFDAPTRNSIVFTQPVIDPDYRNSTIINEPKPRRARPNSFAGGAIARDSAFLADKSNRKTVYLEQPTRPVGAAMADPSFRNSTIVGGRPPSGMPDRKPVRRTARQRPHTMMAPPTIGITKEVPEPNEDPIVDPLMDRMKDHLAPPAKDPMPPRPILRSNISDMYGLHDELLAPGARPSLTPSESTLVNLPLVKPQARPNANQIRQRRQSRASKVASTPLSHSFGVGIGSMYGGGNVGLKEMSYGQYGMNQNFKLVNNRTSQYMADHAEQPKDDIPIKTYVDSPPTRTVKKSKKWVAILYSWARSSKHSKYNEERRHIHKERVDSTPI